MNEIQQKIIKFANQRQKSINHCLYVLGAEWGEVYNTQPNGNSPKTQIYRAQKKSIYDNHTRAELLDWAGYLYKASLIKYHPDKHPENQRLYTEICQEMSKAYLKARKILTRGQPGH